MKYYPKGKHDGIRFWIYSFSMIALMPPTAMLNMPAFLVLVLLNWAFLLGIGSCFMGYHAYLNKRELIRWLRQGNVPVQDKTHKDYGVLYRYIVDEKIRLNTDGKGFVWIDTPDGTIHLLGCSLLEKFHDSIIRKAVRIAHENRQ